ncbi:MAG: hypothetical protein KGL31_05950 [candidate division NC10 bacterium]|nr:hypothetical protein [candidate division NC10 bacterium]MDE2321448.1 hypothetical protein [candidate division NC10 bacterium]
MRLKYLTVGAVASLLLLGSFQAALATDIVDLLFEINTKDEDKDKGEPINFQILKDDKIVVYDSNWIFGNWTLKPNSYNYKRAPWGGAKIIVPITTDDCSKLKLRVEKMGDNSWKATFQVRANDKQLTLLSETPIVQFGKGHPILAEKPEGAGDAKVTHWNGGNVHIFAFNCPPPEKK